MVLRQETGVLISGPLSMCSMGLTLRQADRLRTLAADMSSWADCEVDHSDDSITIDVAGIFDILYFPSALASSAGSGTPILGPDLMPDMHDSHNHNPTSNPNPTRLPSISPIGRESLQNPSPVSNIAPNELASAAIDAMGPNSIAGEMVLPFNDFFLNPFQHSQRWQAESCLNLEDLLLYEATGVESAEDLQAMYSSL